MDKRFCGHLGIAENRVKMNIWHTKPHFYAMGTNFIEEGGLQALQPAVCPWSLLGQKRVSPHPCGKFFGLESRVSQ